MGKRNIVTKKREPQRKKEQEEAAAHAFEEFVATFQDTGNKSDKVWVKAGTYDAGRRQEDTRDKGKLYKPQSRLGEVSSADRAEEYARMMSEKKPEASYKKRGQNEKKKSNLEMFKDELKLIQEEREDRHKYKGAAMSKFEEESPGQSLPKFSLSLEEKTGSHDMGDPNTTNLYLGNLNPKITQQQLMEVFGKYGPLASIKIMWPRSDEERARGRHTGFVAFMTRKDGERAMKGLKGKDVLQHEMKLGWGKTVPIPPRPIYIPPCMLELTRPPPPSGLPFNAQPNKRHRLQPIAPHEPYPNNLHEILHESIVKVVMPNERMLLMTIHRMVEFVIREGPMFEAMIMNREIANPMFRFLFENQSPAHSYYRWKLYSLLQGDSPHSYRTTEFRMFSGGSIWKPPPLNPFTQGMPDDLIEEDEKEPTKGSLSNTQRDRLEDLIRNITQEKIKIAEAMVFCIEHSEAADEICDCIADSLSNLSTAIQKKIARLYLISDILHNCSVKIANVSYYRRGFESRLVDMFKNIHSAYNSLDSRLKAEGFKLRVMQVFRAWEEWAVYPKEFLIKLQNIFLGLTTPLPYNDVAEVSGDEDVDGVPLIEDLDGIPLDGAALLKSVRQMHHVDSTDGTDEDIDGLPMDDVIDQKTLPSGFVPSKWETVDPDQIEAQAMTTSKWDQLEEEPEESSEDDSKDSDLANASAKPGDTHAMNEDRRARLREVELKAVEYQDELEAGTRSLKSCWTIQQQVEHYRRKLLRKSEREQVKDTVDKQRKKQKTSTSPDSVRSSSRKRRSLTPPTPPRIKGVPLTPSPPRIKHSKCSSPSPPRIRHSRVSPPSPPRIKHRRDRESPVRKRRAATPPTPPRIKRRGSPVSSPPRKQHKHRR